MWAAQGGGTGSKGALRTAVVAGTEGLSARGARGASLGESCKPGRAMVGDSDGDGKRAMGNGQCEQWARCTVEFEARGEQLWANGRQGQRSRPVSLERASEERGGRTARQGQARQKRAETKTEAEAANRPHQATWWQWWQW